MRSPQNYGSGLHFRHVSPNTSHTHITQPQYPHHQDITWSPPWHFLSWFVHKTHMVAIWSCLQISSTHIVKKFWSPSSFADLESCCHRWTVGPLQLGSRTHLSREGPGPPFPDRISQIVGINNPPVPKTHKRQRKSWQGNLDKAISFDQEGVSMCSLQLSKQCKHKWPTMAPPYIPDAVVPAPNPGFLQVKGSQSPSNG
jgi:hypothetical protein